MKIYLKVLVLLTSFMCFFACEEKEPIPEPEVHNPEITISAGEVGLNYFNFTISTKDATDAAYLLVENELSENPNAESIFSQGKIASKDEKSYKIENLNDNSKYTIYAASKNEEKFSEVKSISVTTLKEEIKCDFKIAISDIKETSVKYSVDVTNSEVNYLFYYYSNSFISENNLSGDEELHAYIIKNLKFDTKLHNGNIKGDIQDLTPNTEYVAFSYLLNEKGERLSPISRKSFTTLEEIVDSPYTKAVKEELSMGSESLLIPWVLNEKMRVINNGEEMEEAEFNLKTLEDNGIALFEGKIKEDTKYVFVYPSAMYAYFWGGLTMFINFPDTQVYKENAINTGVMPMLAESENLKEANLMNLFGVLSLNLKGEVNVSKIEIINPNLAMTGEASIDFSKLASEGTASTIFSGEIAKTNKVTLDCSANGGVQLSETTATEFNIVLPPSKNDKYELNVRIIHDDGLPIEFTIANDAANAIKRSEVTVLAERTVEVPLPDPDDYIENNINYGKGVTIGNYTWAPINCGFEEVGFQRGKLFQWGRKAGSHYRDSRYPEEEMIQVFVKQGASKTPADDRFYGDWNEQTKWNFRTKTESDPCPEGWRVPTGTEMENLLDAGFYWRNGHAKNSATFPTPLELNGVWIGENCQSATANDYQGCIFLPATGYRGDDGEGLGRGVYGAYWTCSTGDYGRKFLYIDQNPMIVGFQGQFPANGLAVRCVKIKE